MHKEQKQTDTVQCPIKVSALSRRELGAGTKIARHGWITRIFTTLPLSAHPPVLCTVFIQALDLSSSSINPLDVWREKKQDILKNSEQTKARTQNEDRKAEVFSFFTLSCFFRTHWLIGQVAIACPTHKVPKISHYPLYTIPTTNEDGQLWLLWHHCDLKLRLKMFTSFLSWTPIILLASRLVRIQLLKLIRYCTRK